MCIDIADDTYIYVCKSLVRLTMHVHGMCLHSIIVVHVYMRTYTNVYTVHILNALSSLLGY